MTIEVSSSGWPVSATALGVGVWVFFGWCWATAKEGQRLELIARYGWVMVAAMGGGVSFSLATGGMGLSSMGALIGAAAMLVVVVPMWRAADHWTLDHLVPGGVAGLAVARLGCLWQGCDFGRLTDGPIAVVHEVGSRAWHLHLSNYGMSMENGHSLAVHPFAMYLALWGVVAAGCGEWLRRRQQLAGRAGVACAAIFLAGGGVVEWLREPATVPSIADGISMYPWLYWAGAVAAGVVWWNFDAWIAALTDEAGRE